MAVYTFGCKNLKCDYRIEKLFPISEYEPYLNKIKAKQIVCPECGSPLERLLLDYSSVGFDIKGNEESGRTPGGKMLR